MKCEIIWHNQDVAAQKMENMPWPQDVRHGMALAASSSFKPRYGTVSIDGRIAGTVQIMEKRSLLGLIHDVRLERGPVWLTGFGGAHHIRAFFDEFSRQFPARFGRRRFIMPEIEDGPAARKMLESSGLKRISDGYRTCRINLMTFQHDPIVMNDDIRTEWNWGGNGSETKSAFIAALAENPSAAKDMLTGRILRNDEALCTVVIMRHGDYATCLSIWNAGENLSHLLLRDACAVLKETGITLFDFGGIHDNADSIRLFQEGMHGKLYTLAGCYA